MKKIQLAAFIAAAGLMLGSAYAAGLDAPVPPSFNDAPDNIQRPSKSGETIEEKVTDLNQKNPDIVNSKAGKKDTKAEEAQSKKDLKAGEYMDGYGAYTCYGLIEKYETAKEMNAVPIGLVDRKTKVLKDIKKGEVITYDMVEIDKSTKLYHLRQLQEQLQAEGFWDAK